MGNTDSAQQLGERVITARRKLEDDRKIQAERSSFFKTKSPESIKVMIDSIAKSFQSCSPFLETVLLVAWDCDPQTCKNIVLKSCKKVLKAPIIKEEYEWFRQYVFPSSIWMLETQPNHYMYEQLLQIANEMSKDIIGSMDNIYEHLKLHWKWKELMNIQNQTLVTRQDDQKVGLLQSKGIQKVLEVKDDNIDDMKTFIDSNVAVNILTTTAKNINNEFQNHMNTALGRFGHVQSGPIKKVERCQSKLENDYQNEQFPKAAKLLDLVRCSVTFNTLQQLIDGYNGLMTHMRNNPQMIELARVKNGFLDASDGGYRDVKVNVIYHSQINAGVSMICEIQLLFGQYLHEKKRIHKLYNVLRQNEYFKMVVAHDAQKSAELMKDLKDLKLTPVLNMSKDVKMNGTPFNSGWHYGSCLDADLNLLALEGGKWYGCIDMKKKIAILEEKVDLETHNRHMTHWATINNQKYLSTKTAKNTIKLFQLKSNNNDSYSFKEDKKYGINLSSNDIINVFEFDANFQNVMTVRNSNILEKRSVDKINTVTKAVKLTEQIGTATVKMVSLSNDGNFCVLAGGDNVPYSYFVDIENNKQTKLHSGKIGHTYAPCFINGETKFIGVGSAYGVVEIWDVLKAEVVQTIKDCTSLVSATTSTNNILAVCTWDMQLRLYDVRNWKIFYSQKYGMEQYSLHLTADSKYLTIAGRKGEQCVVLEIQ